MTIDERIDELSTTLAALLETKLKRGLAYSNPADVKRYLAAELCTEQHEVFMAMFLDSRHRLIVTARMFNGTIDGCTVHPRLLVKRALDENAAAVILGHNHPSGVPEPSAADEQLTRTLKEALALVDVRLLDHIVVAGMNSVSMAERGLM